LHLDCVVLLILCACDTSSVCVFDLSHFWLRFQCEWKLQVVKNVASQSLEVKKLVYLYLLHYAEKYVEFYHFFFISFYLDVVLFF
jgi:hypothetical protein